jgi:DNA-binding FadR family transcriptional regulator
VEQARTVEVIADQDLATARRLMQQHIAEVTSAYARRASAPI